SREGSHDGDRTLTPDPHRPDHASRCQFCSAQKSESQPLRSTRRRLLMAGVAGRWTTGITTRVWITRAVILMQSAARLTGSISLSAARNSLSYSSLRQRVMFRPCHLLSLEATSHDANWSMKSSGSGCVIVVVYIWMSV